MDTPCNQTCMNTPGSYYCMCDEQYKLNDDMHSCDRKFLSLPSILPKNSFYEMGF